MKIFKHCFRRVRAIRRRVGLFLIVGVALILLMAINATAYGQQFSHYYVRHTFQLTPYFPWMTPVAFGGHYDHAYVQTRGLPPSDQSDVDPSPQPNPFWGPYGQDRDRFLWIDNRSTLGTWLPASMGWTPPITAPWNDSWSAFASRHGSMAMANSEIFLQGNWPMVANLYSWGFSYASRNTGWSRAYAFSATKIVVFGVRRGNIRWGVFVGSASGSSSARYDPVDFMVTDSLSGDTLQTGNLMAITVDHIQPNPNDTLDFWWEDNSVHIGAIDLNFEITMNTGYVDSGWGQIDLEINDGVVTKSNKSGVFQYAWLPSLGETTPLNFDLDTTIEFTYNLPETIPEHSILDYQVHLGGSGMNDTFPPISSPALTEWGVLVLVLLLLAAGMTVIIRRRRVMAQA